MNSLASAQLQWDDHVPLAALAGDDLRRAYIRPRAHDRVAVLIDGVHRLGLEIARYLGRSGRHIVITGDNPEDGCAQVQRLLLEGVGASFRYVDLDHIVDLQRLASDVSSVYGVLDTLVCHAVPGLIRYPSAEVTGGLLSSDPALLGALIERAVKRVVTLSRVMLPVMRGRGAGRIVHVLPNHHEQMRGVGSTWPDGCAVSTVVTLLVEQLGSELLTRGVHINGVALAAPGVRRRRDPGAWLIRRCAQRVLNLAVASDPPQGKILYSG